MTALRLHYAALVLANGDFWDGHMGGGWWIVMGLGMILFWGLVIVGIVFLVRWGADSFGPGDRATGAAEPDAIAILERRFAEGEISVEEYRERRGALTGRPGG